MSLAVDILVVLAILVGLFLGVGSIYWVKARPCVNRARWGRRLFVGTIVCLGVVAIVAAFMHAIGLAPLGLLSGLLIVGMLWETPAETVEPTASKLAG